MNLPINTTIMANPLNWIIIFLMLVFSMFIADILMRYAGSAPCGCGDK
jgi:hypothetical protein